MEEKDYLKETQDSLFCETLMRVAGAVGHLARPTDCAIVLASDGSSVISRQHGLYPDALNMVYQKMLYDDKFAELVLEASMLYTRRKEAQPQENA